MPSTREDWLEWDLETKKTWLRIVESSGATSSPDFFSKSANFFTRLSVLLPKERLYRLLRTPGW